MKPREVENGLIFDWGIQMDPATKTPTDRMVMQLALKITRFCDFSSEIMSTQFRGIIAEAYDENPVDKPSMTKVF